jgi:hypothetical protein
MVNGKNPAKDTWFACSCTDYLDEIDFIEQALPNKSRVNVCPVVRHTNPIACPPTHPKSIIRLRFHTKTILFARFVRRFAHRFARNFAQRFARSCIGYLENTQILLVPSNKSRRQIARLSLGAKETKSAKVTKPLSQWSATSRQHIE